MPGEPSILLRALLEKAKYHPSLSANRVGWLLGGNNNLNALPEMHLPPSDTNVGFGVNITKHNYDEDKEKDALESTAFTEDKQTRASGIYDAGTNSIYSGLGSGSEYDPVGNFAHESAHAQQWNDALNTWRRGGRAPRLANAVHNTPTGVLKWMLRGAKENRLPSLWDAEDTLIGVGPMISKTQLTPLIEELIANYQGELARAPRGTVASQLELAKQIPGSSALFDMVAFPHYPGYENQSMQQQLIGAIKDVIRNLSQ